eukprot:44754-Chlamydomonas_euryale.AAC.2
MAYAGADAVVWGAVVWGAACARVTPPCAACKEALERQRSMRHESQWNLVTVQADRAVMHSLRCVRLHQRAAGMMQGVPGALVRSLVGHMRQQQLRFQLSR